MVAHAARSSAVVALAVACLFLCVADCSAQASPKASPACSRERSRHARAVLDEFFHPVVDKNRFELPPACPFARAKDMYLEHERHKEVVRRTQYKSLYSDKTFKSEYYVDKHMDNRYSDKIRRARTQPGGVLRRPGAAVSAAGARRTPRRASSTRWMPSGSTRMNATRPRWRARALRAPSRGAFNRERRLRRCRSPRRTRRHDARTFQAALRVPDAVASVFTRWRGTGRRKQAQARVRGSWCSRWRRTTRRWRAGGGFARRTWRSGGAGAGSASSARKPRRSSPAFSRASG